jgi:chemotaxis protein MotB
MQVPQQQHPSGEDIARPKLKRRFTQRQQTIAIVAGAVVVGLLVGWLVAPSKKKELAETKEQLETAQKTATTASERATGLDKKVETLEKAKAYVEDQLKETQGKAKDLEQKASDAEALQKKLQATIDKSQGSVTFEGNEIHLKLVDKVLFAVGEDQLSDNGKKVLDKVAPVLKDLPDKAVWVQGHTDDQPIYVAPKKDAAKPVAKDKKGKPVKTAAAAPVPAPMRPITNWELSAERALSVVHYLQDHGKIDPTRLAALAFGQWHPISKSNKAANRRIEIVLVPRREVLQK